MNLPAYLGARSREVDRALARHVPLPPGPHRPVYRAMRHSLFAGGKRLRPILLLAAAEACGGRRAGAMPLACAVECIHTYSLIHDDLPSMDNDDFRRGKPTCHKVFGEAMAILAGDALLTLAFEIAAGARASARFDAGDYTRELAEAAGARQLIAGQVADLLSEGKRVSLARLRDIHRWKTAALLAASLRLGGMSAGAPPAEMRALGRFGRALGLAFQVIDDILDVTQSSAKLGKSAGKDAKAGKATYPRLLGLEASRREAARLTAEARRALGIFGAKGAMLRALADHLLARDY